jgi:hypothetical protein
MLIPRTSRRAAVIATSWNLAGVSTVVLSRARRDEAGEKSERVGCLERVFGKGVWKGGRSIIRVLTRRRNEDGGLTASAA